MKYRRRDQPEEGFKYTDTNGNTSNNRKTRDDNDKDDDNDLSSSDEEIINDKTMPQINNEEKYFLKKIFPFLPSKSSSSTSKLIFSLILDFIGFFTQIIPIFGFAFWPSISTYLIFKVYGSGMHLILSFAEETIPGLGFIPTASLCWANEKYNLIPKINRYLPTKYIKIVKNFISIFKKISIGVVLFLIYKIISYFSPYLPFFGSGGQHQSQSSSQQQKWWSF